MVPLAQSGAGSVAGPPHRLQTALLRLIVHTSLILSLVILEACTPPQASQQKQSLLDLSAACSTQTPFTVKDEVEMRRLSDPDMLTASYVPAKFKLSPDGRHVLLVDQIASATSGQIRSRLLIHDMEAIEAYARQEAERPLPRILAEHERGDTETFSPFESKVWNRMRTSAILQARWLDNETITYLGDRPGKARQLYSVNITTGEIQQLTDNSRSLFDYALAKDSKRFVFATSVPAVQPEFGKRHYLVDTRRLVFLRDYSESEDPMPWLQFFAGELGQPDRTRKMGDPFSGIVLLNVSPDGRHAIAVMRPFKENSPQLADIFERFPQLLEDAPYLAWSNEQFDPYTMYPIDAGVEQYQLFDLESAEFSPLIDAPKRTTSLQPMESLLAWSPDGQSVVVSNVYLQKTENQPHNAAIIVRDLEAGSAEVLISHDEIDVLAGRSVGSPELDWLADGTIAVSFEGNRILFQRNGEEEWQMVNAPDAVLPNKPEKTKTQLSLTLEQSLTEPPVILAHAAGEEEPVLLDPISPRLACKTLGQVRTYTWSGSDGSDWEGGLVYPVGYTPEQRYGLVIQTSGYSKSRYLIGGMRGSAAPTPPYAAQALANRGMFVLVLSPQAGGGREELLQFRAGVEAAIDSLDEAGLIDRRRVGLAGFSRTGLYVGDLITFSDINFAAAVTSDSTALSFDTLNAAFGSSLMNDIHGLTGSAPWGETLPDFVEHFPVLHTDKISTPLRIEEFNPYGSSWYNYYTLLRMQHKPVEMEVFPYGSHPLAFPADQYRSGQTSVDWFAYWLNQDRRLDPQPGTAETADSLIAQYERWDELRDLSPEP